MSRGRVSIFEGPTRLQAYIFDGFSTSKAFLVDRATKKWVFRFGCNGSRLLTQLYIVPLIQYIPKTPTTNIITKNKTQPTSIPLWN